MRHNPFLELYYAEPKRYALVMQIWLLKQRYRTYVNAIKYLVSNPEIQCVVLDRSIYSDGTFAEQNFKDGNFTKEAYDYYKALSAQMMAQLPPPSLVLYLDVSAECCHKRIHDLRQRECENGIPLPYLQGLEQCHHNMIQNLKDVDIKVLNLNWKDFGTENTIDYIQQQINRSPMVQQSVELRTFVSDDTCVLEQSKLRASSSTNRELLAEQQKVEELMVATVDPSTLTAGEVDFEEVARKTITNGEFELIVAAKTETELIV